MLPVLGSAIQIYRANPKHPHLALAKLAETYGDIFSFGFGMQTAGKKVYLYGHNEHRLLKFYLHFLTVVVSSPDTMRELFKLHDTNASRFEFSFVNDRNYGKNLGENIFQVPTCYEFCKNLFVQE